MLNPRALIIILQIVPAFSEISYSDYLLMPAIFHLDSYDKCMLYGKDFFFCSITYKVQPINEKNPSKVWEIIKELSSDITNYRHDILRHGICIPETYPNITRNVYGDLDKSRQELTRHYNKRYKSIGLKGEITKINCESKNSPYVIDGYDKLFAYSVAFYLIVIIVVTLYEEILRHGSEEKYIKNTTSFLGQIVLALSIRKNWQRLMTVNPLSSDDKALSFMQAIRLYIMVTVVLCHTATSYLVGPVLNTFHVEKGTKIQTLKAQIDSALSMQTFFLMTSWLLTYHFFMVHEKSHTVPLTYLWKQFAKRYIRLTPVLAFVVLFASTIMVHHSRGPVWDDIVGDTYRKCRENWWTNLLYVNNVVNEENMCLSHTWFLATNTQLYVLSLLVLYLMWNYPKKIWHILGTVLLFHIFYMFYTIFVNGYQHRAPPVIEGVYNEQFMKMRQWHEMWTSCWANLAGVVAGITYGYIFYKIRNNDININKVYILLCWTIGFGIPLFIIVADQLIFVTDNRLYNALYGSVKRIIFSFSVGLAMLMMTKQKIGLISWFYESAPLYILGRLTYSMYVVHPVIQRVLEGSKRSPSYLDKKIIYMKAMGDFTTALMGATILFLFIEMPVLELVKLFLSKRKVETSVCQKNE